MSVRQFKNVFYKARYQFDRIDVIPNNQFMARERTCRTCNNPNRLTDVNVCINKSFAQNRHPNPSYYHVSSN